MLKTGILGFRQQNKGVFFFCCWKGRRTLLSVCAFVVVRIERDLSVSWRTPMFFGQFWQSDRLPNGFPVADRCLFPRCPGYSETMPIDLWFRVSEKRALFWAWKTQMAALAANVPCDTGTARASHLKTKKKEVYLKNKRVGWFLLGSDDRSLPILGEDKQSKFLRNVVASPLALSKNKRGFSDVAELWQWPLGVRSSLFNSKMRCQSKYDILPAEYNTTSWKQRESCPFFFLFLVLNFRGKCRRKLRGKITNRLSHSIGFVPKDVTKRQQSRHLQK